MRPPSTRWIIQTYIKLTAALLLMAGESTFWTAEATAPTRGLAKAGASRAPSTAGFIGLWD